MDNSFKIELTKLFELYTKYLVELNLHEHEYCFLFDKIISNTEAALILINNTVKYKEALIILRSALETSLLLSYLFVYPEKYEDYKNDCNLAQFKNAFITYRDQIMHNRDIVKNTEKEEDLDYFQKNLYFTYGNLSKKHKDKYKNELHIDEDKIILNDSSTSRLETLLANEKLIFSRIYYLIEELEKKPFLEKKLFVKRTFWFEYNKLSQLSHSEMHAWLDEKMHSDFNIYHTIQMILILPICYMCIQNDSETKKELYATIEKLNFITF